MENEFVEALSPLGLARGFQVLGGKYEYLREERTEQGGGREGRETADHR